MCVNKQILSRNIHLAQSYFSTDCQIFYVLKKCSFPFVTFDYTRHSLKPLEQFDIRTSAKGCSWRHWPLLSYIRDGWDVWIFQPGIMSDQHKVSYYTIRRWRRNFFKISRHPAGGRKKLRRSTSLQLHASPTFRKPVKVDNNFDAGVEYLLQVNLIHYTNLNFLQKFISFFLG